MWGVPQTPTLEDWGRVPLPGWVGGSSLADSGVTRAARGPGLYPNIITTLKTEILFLGH